MIDQSVFLKYCKIEFLVHEEYKHFCTEVIALGKHHEEAATFKNMLKCVKWICQELLIC